MIRLAKLSEIEEIMAITRACAAKMVANNIYQWNEEYPNIEAFRKDVARDELFVLLINNNISACITISSEKDEEYNAIDWLTPDGNQIYIHRLAVHPTFQHQGFAKELMNFAEKLSVEKKAVSVRLDTFSKNKRNQKFYEARGYQRLGDVYFPRQTKYPFHCYELVL